MGDIACTANMLSDVLSMPISFPFRYGFGLLVHSWSDRTVSSGKVKFQLLRFRTKRARCYNDTDERIVSQNS